MIPDYHGEDDMIADLHDEDTDDQEDEDEDEQGGIADHVKRRHSLYSPTPSVGSRTNRSIHIVTKYYCVFRELPLMMCFYGFLWVLAMCLATQYKMFVWRDESYCKHKTYLWVTKIK